MLEPDILRPFCTPPLTYLLGTFFSTVKSLLGYEGMGRGLSMKLAPGPVCAMHPGPQGGVVPWL